MNVIDRVTRSATDRFLDQAQKRFSVSRAVLFGSRARGQHAASSDADVAVIMTGPPAEFLRTKLALADIAFDVLLETGVLIQPLPIWEEEWDHPARYPNPQLLQNIRRDGVPL